MRALLLALLLPLPALAADDFPLGPDSKPQADAPKGEMIKDTFKAGHASVFPGTEREVVIYVPKQLDRSKPAPFMVFQDGVIYQAPVVLDNLIHKKELSPMIGIFIRPGVVPAANGNALPRYNRSFEYDSVTSTYSQFLISELLPELEKRHHIELSTDPNDAAISGNSSGGICAFMVAWHRPDRFRRVFTGVGTYVGIHGADQLPVMVRKHEPKALRVFLQSGTNDNNLYCGDWWMANQMMERSLTWAGYDVNHAWGEGGHNQKHASQIFPDVMRWLWRDWQKDKVVKANPKGESKWKGYEVVSDEGWERFFKLPEGRSFTYPCKLVPFADGSIHVAAISEANRFVLRLDATGKEKWLQISHEQIFAMTAAPNNELRIAVWNQKPQPHLTILAVDREGQETGPSVVVSKGTDNDYPSPVSMCCDHTGRLYFGDRSENMIFWVNPDGKYGDFRNSFTNDHGTMSHLCLSPDQTQIFAAGDYDPAQFNSFQIAVGAPKLLNAQPYYKLDVAEQGSRFRSEGMCVDIEGRLYVATTLGIQVCDQAGRVNFIIPTPKQPHDVCFGGKDLSELFIACGDTIYKRPTKTHGIVSGQMPPIKPAAPKL